jgi:hypothetical protein
MCAELDLPLITTIEMAGLKDSLYAKSFQRLRGKHVALQQLVEVVSELRGPVQTFFGKIKLKSGPHKRMSAVSHPLLDHPICQPGGAALTDREWLAVRTAMVDLLASKHAAKRLVTARMDLDYFFQSVRQRVSMAKVCPPNLGSNVMRRIDSLQSTGDFQNATRVLLTLAGKRGVDEIYQVPLF